MGLFDSLTKPITQTVKQAAKQSSKPPPVYPKSGGVPNKQAFDDRENYIADIRTNMPGGANIPIDQIYHAYNTRGSSGGGSSGSAPKKSSGGGSKSSGGSRGYSVSYRGGGGRGGGGGGGGGSAAANAQKQLDLLLQVIGSKSYTAAPETALRDQIAQRTNSLNTATQQDLGAANTAYDAADRWMNANLSNPYANVALQRASVGPSYNPYLESQGVAPLNNVTSNPDDSYGGFQNVLNLLGAAQLGSIQSSKAGTQQARASSISNINAGDNAFRDAIQQQLAAVAQKEYENQQALDAEKRQAVLQLLPLLGAGAKAPTDIMTRLGLA